MLEIFRFVIKENTACVVAACQNIPHFNIVKLFNDHILFQEHTPFKFIYVNQVFKFHFPPAQTLKQVFFSF